MKTERLQKILARGGLASRRAAESLITEGRVRVNGKVVTELGAKADPMKDKVEVDGKRVIAEDPVYVLLHKDRGVVSTMSDPEGRPTVAEPLSEVRSANGKAVRMYPVGRLDFATSGALLATNDGAFADALLHPREGVPKTYVVKVSGVMEEKDLDLWRDGVQLEDGVTLPAKLSLLRHEEGKTWLELTIREGRNQQIRRMGEATGFPVMRLARTSFAGVTTEGLPPGRWRMLTREELLDIKKMYGVPRRVPAGTTMIMGDRSGRAPRGRAERNARPQPRPERAERAATPERRGPNTHARRNGPGEVARPEIVRAAPARGGRDRDRAKDEAPRGGRSNRFGRNDRSERTGGTERTGREAANAESTGAPTESRGANVRARGRTSGHASSRGPAPSHGSQSSPTQGARYGGGSPGRRSYEVREDWGGGSERGRTRDDGAAASDAPARGRSGGSHGTGRGSSSGGSTDEAPRGDLGGGRFGRTRTTGTAGGIGARSDILPNEQSGRRGAGGGPMGGKTRHTRGGGGGGNTRGSSGGRGRGR